MSCADHDSFGRGSPNLGGLVFWGVFCFVLILSLRVDAEFKYHYRRAIIGAEMAFRWSANNGPTLNAGLEAL